MAPAPVRCMRPWRRSNDGRPSSSKATTSPSSTADLPSRAAATAAASGYWRGTAFEVAALEVGGAVLREVSHGADAVPLDLVAPALVVRREGGELGEHRDDVLG